MFKVMGCGLEVSGFELPLGYYFQFNIQFLG